MWHSNDMFHYMFNSEFATSSFYVTLFMASKALVGNPDLERPRERSGCNGGLLGDDDDDDDALCLSFPPIQE